MNLMKEKISFESVSEKEAEKFLDTYCCFHISYNPIVLNRKNWGEWTFSVGNSIEAREFVVNNELKVISCDYGCNCNNPIEFLNRQKFLEYLEDNGILVETSDLTNDFRIIFKFFVNKKECFYVFSSGDNGQEFLSALSLPSFELIKEKVLIEKVKDIDNFLYEALEKYNYCKINFS